MNYFLLFFLFSLFNTSFLGAMSLEDAIKRALNSNLDLKILKSSKAIQNLVLQRKNFSLDDEAGLPKLEMDLMLRNHQEQLKDLNFKIRNTVYLLYYHKSIYEEFYKTTLDRVDLQKKEYQKKLNSYNAGKINKNELKEFFQNYINIKNQSNIIYKNYENIRLQFIMLLNMNFDFNLEMDFHKVLNDIKPFQENSDFKNNYQKFLKENNKIKIYQLEILIEKTKYKLFLNQDAENRSELTKKIENHQKNIKIYQSLKKIQKIKEDFLMSYLKVKNSYLQMILEENMLSILKTEKANASKKYAEGRIDFFTLKLIENEYQQKNYSYLLSVIDYNIAFWEYLFFIELS